MPIMFETIQKFINHKRLSLSAHKNYRSILKRLLLFCEGELSTEKIEAFLTLQRTSRNTLRTNISRICTYTKYLYKSGFTEKDYGCDLVRPKKEKIPKDLLTVPECFKSLKTIREDESRAEKWRVRDYAIYSLFLATGIRLSALTNLKLKDFSVRPAQIRITRKGGGFQVIPISSSVVKVLNDWLKERSKILPPGSKADSLFISQRRKNISVSAVAGIINRWFVKTGIEGKHITTHCLRHTYATNMLNGGCPIQVVSENLGHANLATTHVYAHALESQLVKAAESFDLESGSIYQFK